MDASLDYEITAIDLLEAYRAGVFPMSEGADDPSVFWVDPPMRGIIPLEGFHVPASLKKLLKKRLFDVRVNTAFEAVISACADETAARGETWINAQIKNWYCELNRLGHAHSIECWDNDNQLVGGLYGLAIGGAFFGESMFSRVTGASKIALVHLVAHLRARGFTLLDCQFVNPHLLQFGCIEIPRDDYHSLLASALSLSDVSFSGAGSAFVTDSVALAGVLQSSTLTS